MPLFALLAAALASTPGAPTPLDESLALARQVKAKGCAKSVMGASWAWAPLGCDAFTAFALTSAAQAAPQAQRAQALAALDALLDHALGEEAQRPFASTGATSVGDRTLPRSVLYRGLVLLMLAGREKLEPGGARSALFDAQAVALARDLAASPAGWLPTYGKDELWACDHAPAAAALLLHGRLRGDDRTAAAGQRLVKALVGLRAAPGGFPTRIKPSGEIVGATPRGVAMAWTAGFLLHGDPAAATGFAADFVARFCERLAAVAACREWPRGVTGKADADSGPIVQGLGMGASALGLAATRALADDGWHAALLRAADLAGIGEIRKSSDLYGLEKAIDLWGRTAVSWMPQPASLEPK